jgi:predicted ATPase/DNA-binding SARP family transcriptional activator
MPHLQISCLGDFSATLAGRPITANFDTDKTRALLIYLVVEAARPQPRGRLGGLLWPDQPEERALHNLRQRLLHLRKTLGDEIAAAPYLIITRDTVQWNTASDYWLDIQAFGQTLSGAFQHYQQREGQGRLNIRDLKQALQLYQGQFLESFYISDSDLFSEWAAMQREDCNRRAVEALALLAEYHERRGEYALARQANERIIRLAPWEETAQTQVMRLLAMDQQWSAAQHQYALLRRYLQEQLGVEPSRASTALFEQIRLAAAQQTFIPARFQPALHNFLPAPTPFVGRAHVLDRIAGQLIDPACRLLTLLGPGGVGKTRLALEVGYEQVGLWPDGVFFTPLATAHTPIQLLSAVAEAVNFVFAERGDPQTQLLAFLRAKHMLLILDNFEQLVTADVLALLAKTLQQAPGLMLLVTSRERLTLQEEHVYVVDGLEYPAALPPLETAEAFDALALFTRRACQVRSDFSFNMETLPAVTHICQLLAGLPLGVELAAAATWSCSCAEIAQRIARDFDELTASAVNVPARHRSLHAVVDVSWQLLTATQQAFFCQLAVFRGGFEAAAAAAVAGRDLAFAEVETLLSALVNKSLVRRAVDGRYDLHEVIRQYAADRLDEQPELLASAAERQASYYVELLARQNEMLKGSVQATALETIHREIENARCAWEWLIEKRHAVELCRCIDSLYIYFNVRSYFAEGSVWFQHAIQAFDGDESAALALGMSLTRLGALAFRMRQNASALEALTRSQTIFEKLPEPAELALCLIYLSGVRLRQAEHDTAIALGQQSLALYRSIGDLWGESYALYLLGLIKNRQGLFDEAQPLSEDSITLARQLGNPHRLIAPLNLLGDIACIKGDYPAADRYFRESLALSRALNDRYNQGILLNNLATVYQAQQRYEAEKAAFDASLAICREIGDRDGEATALNGLGEMAVHLADYPQAAVYSRQALEIAQGVGDVWTVIICLNNLGEALCGLGELALAEAYLQQALQAANEAEALDLVAKVTASLGWVYQKRGEYERARQFLRAALAHPAIEDEPRAKAQRWLAESEMADKSD